MVKLNTELKLAALVQLAQTEMNKFIVTADTYTPRHVRSARQEQRREVRKHPPMHPNVDLSLQTRAHRALLAVSVRQGKDFSFSGRTLKVRIAALLDTARAAYYIRKV